MLTKLDVVRIAAVAALLSRAASTSITADSLSADSTATVELKVSDLGFRFLPLDY